jgi:peptidoglycan/xylan/chitin deacetylase (PgdA/CDA1 family)
MTFRRLPEGVRLWGSMAVVVCMALGMVAWARYLTYHPRPSAESDLDVPSLFVAGSRDWETVPESSRPSGIPILCYHYFRPGLTPSRFFRVLGAVLLNMPTVPANDFWTTTVPEFDRQMRWLHDHGFSTISLDRLADWMDGGDAPPRSVVITFDDGDETVVKYAVPVLRRYGFQGTLFLLTGRTGETGWNDVDFVDWDTLRALEREGVLRVQSHTHRMHTKQRVDGRSVPCFLVAARDSTGRPAPNSALVQDLRTSRAVIRRELGHDATFLAWPFGFGDAVVDSIARANGFRRVLTLRPERNGPEPDEPRAEEERESLGRYAVTARTSMRIFRRMVETRRAVGTVP